MVFPLVERDTQTFDKTMLQEKYYPICLFLSFKKGFKGFTTHFKCCAHISLAL